MSETPLAGRTVQSTAGGTERPASILTLISVTLLTGVGAGLGGMLLALLLHVVQHLAFGYSQHAVISAESFLDGVQAAGAARRWWVLLLCGAVAGLGWWAVRRYGKPLVAIASATKAADPRLPPGSTTAHALLQIITVALGSPLGREVAPREIGALLGGWLAHKAGLNTRQCQIMLACGAGAGLAAVYNVPLAGAAFVLEGLLFTFAWDAVIPALATSVLAAVVAWIGLGNEMQYVVPALHINASLVFWSCLAGPLFGWGAHLFVRLTTAARAAAPKDGRIIPLCLLNFAVIGTLAITLPQLLGNGKGPAHLSFDGDLGMTMALLLLVLRLAITASTLRAGAQGGLLTPGLACGALLAVVLGGLWSLAWPGVTPGAYAIVGACAFLAASMRLPLTALLLVLEFTRVEQDFVVPMLLATAGSLAVFHLCATGAKPVK